MRLGPFCPGEDRALGITVPRSLYEEELGGKRESSTAKQGAVTRRKGMGLKQQVGEHHRGLQTTSSRA